MLINANKHLKYLFPDCSILALRDFEYKYIFWVNITKLATEKKNFMSNNNFQYSHPNFLKLVKYIKMQKNKIQTSFIHSKIAKSKD